MSVEAPAVSVAPLGLVKMEDRKRPSASDHHDDSAPPAKRLVTNVNGPVAESAADAPKFGTHNSPWQVELEVRPKRNKAADPFSDYQTIQTFQKDALLRQMREFKREKVQLEQQVDLLQKTSSSHLEYILTVDSWLNQVSNLHLPHLWDAAADTSLSFLTKSASSLATSGL